MNHANLPVAVDFGEQSLVIINHAGQPWLAATDLARALGYADDRSVSRIYRRNAGEFADGMSEVVNLTPTRGMPTETRIFSPRGCHLIAMFARTPRAAAFRRWVLDVLEGLSLPPAPAPAPAAPAELLPLHEAMMTEPARQLLASHLMSLIDRFGATPYAVRELERHDQLPVPPAIQQELRTLKMQTRQLARQMNNLAANAQRWE